MPIDWKPEALPVAPAAGVVVRRHLLVMPIDWKHGNFREHLSSEFGVATCW